MPLKNLFVCDKKTLCKTITWRIIASATTFTIAYFIQGEIESAGLITLMDTLSKTLFYYMHENAWENYGKKQNSEEE